MYVLVAGMDTTIAYQRKTNMKIGILTFHYSSNQGSIMQAFCSYNLLREAFPEAQVELINLVPVTREVNEILFLKKRFPVINVNKFLRYVRLRKFTRKNMALSKRSYADRLEKQVKFINEQNYNVVITGSDTIWFYSKWLRYRIPTVYFLPSEITAKKIAFAASVDPLNNSEVYLQKKEELKGIFHQYDSITVRDTTTDGLLNNLGCSGHQLIADPSLLYNFEEKLNLQRSNDQPIRPIRKIGLGIADKKLTREIIEILNKMGSFEIVDFFAPMPIGYDHFVDELNLYHTFDVFIGDRFHRTIFSLKLSNALTLYIENPSYNKLSNSKGRDLLSRMGLHQYVLVCARGELGALETVLRERVASWSDDELQNRNELVTKFITENKEGFSQYICDTIQ